MGLTPAEGFRVAQLRLDAASEALEGVSAEALAAAQAALDEAREKMEKMETQCHLCDGTGFIHEWRPGSGGMCRCGTGASYFDPS